ncbi:MAG TPA: DUF1275 domain-containing protein [Candidatus Mediterraneibacter stercoripullorum]|nr:DUF1275 domain-containing protein [Candidatus Mediterraneibacter stercoripullorum]
MQSKNKSARRMHFIMAVCGGFFGGYAIFGRMAVFGSAQTANLIELVGDILGRNVTDAMLRIGALAIYAGAMVLFMFLTKKTVWNLKYLVFLAEICTAAALGFVPAEADPVVALYPVFFTMSFQWCVFKGADGYACSTIFSTNNVKQTVLSFSEYFLTDRSRTEERAALLDKGKFFGCTLLCFHFGVGCAWIGLQAAGLRAVWLVLIPVLAGLCVTEAEEGGLKAAAKLCISRLTGTASVE